MIRLRLYMKMLLLVTGVFFFTYMTGCKENSVQPADNEPTTDQLAFEKLADEDSSLATFDANYNEEDISDFLGKTAMQIYPFRFGHKARLVSKSLTYDVVADTAYATMTKVFKDTLFIAASYDSGATHPDTIIKKGYSSVIVRNLIFLRTGKSNRPYKNWKLAAISLPVGNTTPHNNIKINEIKMELPNETITITNPLNFYLSRGIGWWKQLPSVARNVNLTVSVEVFSTEQDTDFVTLTWGADDKGLHRSKKKFALLTSTPSGTGYIKVYRQVFSANANPGFFHAVINAFPKNVIFDDAAAVQNESWGFPYFVRKL